MIKETEKQKQKKKRRVPRRAMSAGHRVESFQEHINNKALKKTDQSASFHH
jgi:hypothetical protein